MISFLCLDVKISTKSVEVLCEHMETYILCFLFLHVFCASKFQIDAGGIFDLKIINFFFTRISPRLTPA